MSQETRKRKPWIAAAAAPRLFYRAVGAGRVTALVPVADWHRRAFEEPLRRDGFLDL